MLDAFEEQGGFFLVMPFVQGEPLDRHAERRKGLSESRAMDLAVRLGGVLEAVHAQDLLHGDLKPSNVFIRPNAAPVLIDFGSSARLSDPNPEVLIFTPGFSAPEMRDPEGRRGAWSDVYSMAATLCAAIRADRPPPDGYPPEAAEDPRLPAALRPAIARALAAEPLARPESPAAFLALAGLQAAAQAAGPEGEAPPNSLFISYARLDAPKVEPLVAALQRHGVSAWIDRQGIPPGAAWASAIVKGLRSARVCLVFCSRASMGSENVENELYLANREKKPIVAAMLEDVAFPDAVALFLAKAQHLDARSGAAEGFVRDVQAMLAGA